MKRISGDVIAILLLLACILVPSASMAEDLDIGPGFHVENGNTYYYYLDENDVLTMAKGWHEIDGATYFFGKKDGIMKKGKIKVESDVYNFGKKGKMQKGWATFENHRYYFGQTSGKMLKGWQTIGGEKYYFDQATGIMQTGKCRIGDYTYYMNSEGKKQYGWQKIGEYTYYFEDENGRMFCGFHDIGEYRYFFGQENGHLFRGWHTIGEYRYFFNKKDGRMFRGWQTIGEYRYFFNRENGRMLKGFHKIDGATYFFGKTTGRSVTGWVTRGDSKCYFSKKTRKMLLGRNKIGGYTYYFNKKTGKRMKGWRTIGESRYYFGGKYARMFTGIHKIGKNVCTFRTSGKLKRTVYGDRKAICLTFDDGPSVNTDAILSTLKKYDGLATFFVVGDRTGVYQKQLRAAVSMGCQIGNHTQNHKMLASCTEAGIRSQIKKCNASVKSNAGAIPRICRTPGGEYSSTIQKNVGLPIILWSVDTLDWKTQSASATYDAVMAGARDGAVVLMHDLYGPTAEAVKKIVPALDKKGYQLVTIQEMRMLKGKKLKKGIVYYSF